MNYLDMLDANRTSGPEYAATNKPPKRAKSGRSLTKHKKRAKLSVKRSHGTTGNKEGGPKHSKTPRKSPMAKRRKLKGKAKKKFLARMAAGASEPTRKKGKGAPTKRKSAKRRKARKVRAAHSIKMPRGRKGSRKRVGVHVKVGRRRRSRGFSVPRKTKRIYVIAAEKPRRKRRVKHRRRAMANPTRRRKGGHRRSRRGAMENPMSGTELFVGSLFGLVGFLTGDVVDRILATHPLTDKGAKDANGNELYADNPATTGDYTGLFNATAICAPMDAKRWIVGLVVPAVALGGAHFVAAPHVRAALQFFGFAYGVRIVGKGLTDLVARVVNTNPVGQRLYDGEMRAAVLKANNGNGAAAALASLPSAGLGRAPRLGAAAPSCAPCADKQQGTGYPSMPREVAPISAQAPMPPVNVAPPASPATQMAPPSAPAIPPAPPAALPPPPPTANSGLTGPRDGVAGAPRQHNRFNWGHTENR
jgi:hypothetical protein